MGENDLDAKSRIINAALKLLEEEEDLNKITIRRIAELAGVGIGLVNYHFKTKDSLLNEAVGSTMVEMATKWSKPDKDLHEDPVIRLKTMLKELSDFGFRHSRFFQISTTYELMHGDLQAPLYLIPILREIYGSKKDEVQLRVIGFQLITAIQVAFLRSPTFRLYTGIDLSDGEQRNNFIDNLVDNLIQ